MPNYFDDVAFELHFVDSVTDAVVVSSFIPYFPLWFFLSLAPPEK